MTSSEVAQTLAAYFDGARVTDFREDDEVIPVMFRARAADRGDGTPRSRRLRQIPPETGRFIAIIAASAPPCTRNDTMPPNFFICRVAAAWPG